MKKIIVLVIILVVILAVSSVFFLNQSKPLAAMAEAQIPERPLVIRYDDSVYEELIKELPEEYLKSDNDKDGITNTEEINMGLNPYTEDSDNDGISDYEEINTYKSDPLKWSTADDGISDLAKVLKNLDVNTPIRDYTPEIINISDEIQLTPEDMNSEILHIFSGYNGVAFKNLTPIVPSFRIYDFTGSVQIDLNSFQHKDFKDIQVYYYDHLSEKIKEWDSVKRDANQLVIDIDEVIEGKPVIITKDSVSQIREWIASLFSNAKNGTKNEPVDALDYQTGYIADSGFIMDKHSFSFGNIPVDCSPGGICSGFAFATNQIYNDMNPRRKMNKNRLYIPILGEISAAPAFDIESNEYDTIFESKMPFKYEVVDNNILAYDYKAEPQENYEIVSISEITQPDQEVVKCISNYWLHANKITMPASAVSKLCNYKSSYDFSKIREIASLFNENQIIYVSFEGSIGGHAVNAYRLEQDKNDTDIFRLYIYDNNYPNNMMVYKDSKGRLKKQQADVFMTISRYPKKSLIGICGMFNFSYGSGLYSWTNTDTTNPAGVRFYRSFETMNLIEIEGFNHEYWERYISISLEVPEQIEYNEEVPIKVIAIDSLGIPRDVTKNVDCSIMIPNDLYSSGCLKDKNTLFLNKEKLGTPYKEFTVTANFRGLNDRIKIKIGEGKSESEKEIDSKTAYSETDEKFIYSSRNILRDDQYTYDGQWIYYNNPYTNELYKIRPDLTENTFICSDTPTFINVWCDEIIYRYGEFAIFAINSDGSNHRRLLEACGDNSPLVFCDNKLLVDYEGLCYIDVEKGEDSFLFDEFKNEPFLYDGWVYYRDLENNSYNKMKSDLSDEQMIIPDFHLLCCVVDEEWVYGFDEDMGYLMRINLKDKSIQNISGEDWFNKGYRMAYTVSNGYVYFENEEDKERLYRINCDTKEIELVSIEENVHDFGIAAGWIFYRSGDNAYIVSEDLQTKINGEDVLRPAQ